MFILEQFEENNEPGYSVKLDVFEGPLDLLLHLIKKHQLNIYDIPIALITRQYLEYLELMKTLNLSIAGDFLVIAATLIHIKSKMLLPPEENPNPEEDEGDPREELVTRLLEYKKFKEASGHFEERESFWVEVFRRRAPEESDPVNEEFVFTDLNLFDLVDALQKVIIRLPEKSILEITQDNLSVADRINSLLEFLENKESASFFELFERDQTRGMVVVTFLALLELCRLRLVQIQQVEELGAIRIRKLLSNTVKEEVIDGNS
ncbi:MAG: segregation/condensation protein A [Nitrospirae bacterium]|nr:segregation/condensation protein A [Nitrospirota bacterium]